MDDSTPIITTDPQELVIERANRARERYNQLLRDITDRVARREISPREGGQEVQACSEAYACAMENIYPPQREGGES
jgi:hypothetical protein